MVSSDEFFDACEAGNTAVIREYIAEGGNINVQDDYGVTALMLVVDCGHIECLRELIKAGADVNITDNTGQTALMCAAALGRNIDYVKELIAAGADINAQDSNGCTALLLVISEDSDDNRIGVDGWYNEDANYICYGYCDDDNDDRIACAKELIAAGANINAKDNYGINAFGYAIMNYHYITALMLVEAGIIVTESDLYIKDEHGCPLIEYCKNNEIKDELMKSPTRHIKAAIKCADKPDIIKGFDTEL